MQAVLLWNLQAHAQVIKSPPPGVTQVLLRRRDIGMQVSAGITSTLPAGMSCMRTTKCVMTAQAPPWPAWSIMKHGQELPLRIACLLQSPTAAESTASPKASLACMHAQRVAARMCLPAGCHSVYSQSSCGPWDILQDSHCRLRMLAAAALHHRLVRRLPQGESQSPAMLETMTAPVRCAGKAEYAHGQMQHAT